MNAAILLALPALLALAATAVPAARGETSSESTIRSGIYTDTTCANPDLLWVYVPDVTIDIDRSGADDSVSIGVLVPDSDPLVHGWQRFRNEYSKDETYEYFLRMATDGRVQLLWWDPRPAKASEPPRRLWSQVLPAGDSEAGEHWNLATYARCESIPFPLVASALVSSYDHDGDGKTSLDELFHAMARQDAASIPGIEGLDPETRSKIEQAITILRGLSERVPGLK